MRKLYLLLILCSVSAFAQVAPPQINLSGNIGAQGFPVLNSGMLQFTSDANRNMTVQETSATGGIKVTSTVPLTATRNLILPAGNFQFIAVENATTGGQSIQVIGQSGTGVTIANGASATVWFDGTNVVQAGSSGSAAPAFAIQFAGTTPGSFNSDATFSFNAATHGLSAYLTNGFFNSDVAQTGGGNNGLANIEAGPCASGGCTPMFPAPSTSTESALPTVSNTHVQDYRNGSQADFFYNPSSAGAAGYNPGGSKPSAAQAFVLNFDQSQVTSGGIGQLGLGEWENFNGPGYTWGTNTNEVTNPLWAAIHAHTFSMNVSTPSIAQYQGGTLNKTSDGDSALDYLYSNIDAGFSSGSDEGADGAVVQVSQNSTWFHGTVGTGATAGTQSLPTVYTSGSLSRPQFAVDGYMLDISRFSIAGGAVTGPSVQMANNGPWAFPVSTTVTESTAWGYANSDIPAPASPIVPGSSTTNFTVVGGTSGAGYTTGKAWLDGAEKVEQVQITAVGSISGGVQSVTFTHSYPNAAQDVGTLTRTFLFQGGTNGFYSPTIIENGTTYGSYRTAYPIFGATDSSHLVGRLSFGGSNDPITSYYNASTTNVLLQNLSVSGTTVTATTVGGDHTVPFQGLTSAVISGASNSAFNGTVTNVKALNNGELQWTQTVTGTSATAYISYAPPTYSFYLFPGARVMQPATTSAPTTAILEPNDTNWTAGDALENVQWPTFRGTLLGGLQTIAAPDVRYTGAIGLQSQGNGINGNYTAFGWLNNNSPILYQGDGGVLTAPLGINFAGPMSTVFTVPAPVDRSPVMRIGCATDGCSSTNNTHILSLNLGAGIMDYIPTTQQFYFTGATTGKIQANILSTGDSHYINGGPTGGAAVALTAASAANQNFYSSLGAYGMLGNETPLDTSADLGAHTFYSGLFHAGANPPVGVGVGVVGTSGSSAYSYVAISNTQTGGSVQSGTISTATGNATLSSTNYNTLQFIMGKGAQSTDIYRTAAPGGYGLGRICTSIDNQSLGGNGPAPCHDTGQATTGSLPTNADTSGNITSAAATIGALTVTSCTGCGSLGGALTSANVAFGAGAGASPSVTYIAGTDGNHQIAIHTGTTTVPAAILFTLTFTASRGHVSYCTISPASAPAGLVATTALIGGASATSYTLTVGTGLADSTNYGWNVSCP